MHAATIILLYDDACAMCASQIHLLTWLDWFNTVTFLPISQTRAAEVAPHLSQGVLGEAIHCVASDGKTYRGARALRYVGLRMPLLAPLALLLWLPGMIWAAEKVYVWVSRNRYILSRVFRCKQACAIMPRPEQRDQNEVPTPTRDR